MDEFLEFNKLVQEALREPLERGRISVSRAGGIKDFPAQFYFIATTNLCPCGRLTPEKVNRCRCSKRKSLAYLEKLSGPMLDRFCGVVFSHDWNLKKGEKTFKLADVLVARGGAQEFAKNMRGQKCLNSRLNIIELKESLKIRDIESIFPQTMGSKRRETSILRLARSFADLDRSEDIQVSHLHEAGLFASVNFRKILQETPSMIQ